MAQDTNINNLIINKLTKAQYDNIASPSPTELYLTTDEIISNSDVITALGYTPYNSTNPNGYITSSALSTKQDTLVSGTNIKTINSTSLLGSGNIAVQPTLVSGTNIKTINNTSILGSGDLSILIPTAISDLTDDTSTNPIDEAESVVDQRDSSSLKYWTGTKAQYDAIVTKDSDTIYNVEDTTSPIVDILNTLYPIGAIYIGTMATCPLSVLGVGTWQLVAQDRVLQGAGTRGAVGTTINESLPNITGTFGTTHYNSLRANGAFNTVWTGTKSGTGTSNGTWVDYGFDASLSSSTYQDNAPVQQDGYLVNIWERIA